LAMKLADEQRVFSGDETCRRVVDVDDARRYVVSRAAWRCYAYVYASTLAPLTFRCQPPAEGSLFFAELLTRQRDGVAAFLQLDGEVFSALYSGSPIYASAPTAGSREEQGVQAARRRAAGRQEMGGENDQAGGAERMISRLESGRRYAAARALYS
jgi:hypothetical protein